MKNERFSFLLKRRRIFLNVLSRLYIIGATFKALKLHQKLMSFGSFALLP